MIKGKVTTVFGPDINTDDIIPARFLQQSTDRDFFKDYAFDECDAEFRSRCAAADANIVVAGENFGCGSSREQAVYALSGNNVTCVIAKSYPDIFYRNSLTNGLTLIAVPDPSAISLGDELSVDLDAGEIINHTTQGTRIPFEMNAEDREIFKQGGRVGRVRRHLEELLAESA